MDLHFTDASAGREEQDAVDAALEGKQAGRHLLLPVLHAIQARAGWISEGALNYACRRLDVAPAEAYGVASFYGMFSLTPRAPVVVHVCDDVGCLVRGAGALCGELERVHGPEGRVWFRSPCLGMCERAPAALVTAAGTSRHEEPIAPATEKQITFALTGMAELPVAPVMDSVPQAGEPGLRLLRRIGVVDPSSIEDYRAYDGFRAMERAREIGREAVIREVADSRLLGRGGAAFPTGKKWGQATYVVCNADESEPGTFKDRVLMEGDPFAVVEAMLIAGFANGCRRGYVYVRGEYPLAAERLEHAIAETRRSGYFPEGFDIEVRRGAGAYICGEETALFNSIEGYRGEPRNKPPFPTQAGLFHEPTVVNNVETLGNVPWIVLEGGERFASIGTEKSTGTKLYCLSGHVARPGVYEAAFGVTLRELIAQAGGVSGSGRLQAILVGGAAGALVSPEELDTPMTFEGMRTIGAALGSAVVMLFDDRVDLKRILLRIARFFREESCGQCVPCRAGTVRQEELLVRMVEGRPLGSLAEERALLKELSQAMRDASICGLGHTASSAIESALARFVIFG